MAAKICLCYAVILLVSLLFSNFTGIPDTVGNKQYITGFTHLARCLLKLFLFA